MTSERAAALAARAEELFWANNGAADSGDPGWAGTVVRLLAQAAELAPNAEDLPLWCHRLGVASAYLAEDDMADWDVAVTWLRRALTGPPHPEVDRDDVTADLVQAMLMRCLDAPSLEAYDQLVTELDELPRPSAGAPQALAVEYLRAVARLGRLELRDDADDLQQARVLLDAVLDDVPDAWPLLPETLAKYAEICADEGRLEVGLTALARARTLMRGQPHGGVDPGDVDPGGDAGAGGPTAADDLGVLLDLIEAQLLDSQLIASDGEVDSDPLIAVLSRIVERADPQPYALGRLGELLCLRGDRTSSPTDLEQGVRWLAVAVDAGAGEGPATWHLRALAHQRRAEILGDAAGFEQAAACYRESLAHQDERIDPDDVTVGLVVALMARYFLTPEVAAVNVLVEAIDRVPRRPAGSLGAVALTYYAAIARLIRVDLVPARVGTDLPDAMARLDATLPRVPDDWSLLTSALRAYARWCVQTGRYDDGLVATARLRRIARPAGDPEYVDPAETDQIEALLRSQGRDPAALQAMLGRASQDTSASADRPAGNAELLGGLQQFIQAVQTGAADDDGRDALRRIEAALRTGVEPAAVGWCLLGAARIELAARLGDDLMRREAEDNLRTALAAGLNELEANLAAFAHRHLAGTIVARLESGGYPDPLIRQGAAAVAAALPLLSDERLTATTRAELAATLLGLVAPAMISELDFDLATFDLLLAAMRAHPTPPADWNAKLGTATLVRDMTAGFVRDGLAGVTPFSESRAREHFGGAPVPDEMIPFVAYQELVRGVATGDRARLRDAREMLGRLDSREARLIRELADAQQAIWEGRDTHAALDRLAESIERYGAQDPAARLLREQMLPAVRLLAMVSRAQTGERVSPREYARLLPALMRGSRSLLQGRPGRRAGQAPPADPLTSALSGVMPLIQATLTSAIPFYPAGARRGILERAARLAGATDPGAIAIGYWQIALENGDRAAVEQTIIWADRALDALQGPQNPDWAGLCLIAAQARRWRQGEGDRERSRRLGLSALKCHTWIVLLQSGTGHALAAAREAIEDALSVADWCAEDGAADDLIVALDAGRGLALHAAVTTRSATTRLVELGERALADQWRAVGGDERVDVGADMSVRSELRRRVLDTLAAGSGDLLEPPRPHQIRAALSAHGSDALVYLVAGGAAEGGGTRPGRVVIVPARSTAAVEIHELPALAAGPGTPLDRYVQSYQTRHQDNTSRRATAAALHAWRADLSTLVAWAGQEVASGLLGAARRWSRDPDCPHLVLVPVGPLALVPWHAALCDDGRGRARPLALQAVVSYTPSARMLCRALAAAPVTGGGTLIVGNPAGRRSLRGAATEARCVHQVFHPEATFYGRRLTAQRRPDGEGTPAEVLAWLRAEPAGRQLLHLACHGHADPADPTRSHLALAGGLLATSELLTHRPTEASPVERVFLCACSSNVSGAQYDEAFSIATAFLAGGARTVFGSMWDVPDELTSRITFAVHHYLDAGHTPAVALHRAQRWTLDPNREALPSMPDEMLAAQTGASDDPAGWAGLVHLGV